MERTGKAGGLLPAEWEEQDGVMLTWPQPDSDWAPMLAEVELVYLEIIAAICRFEPVLLVVPDEASCLRLADLLPGQGVPPTRVRLVVAPGNDTWARDHGPVTVRHRGGLRLLDFRFTGWGNKFAAELDDAITGRLWQAGAFARGNCTLEPVDLVLEGGAIESDGRTTLLTTAACLLNPNRNPDLSRQAIETRLAELLGLSRFLWLHHGYLAGDDTDSHVDTLARFAPDDTICYVACDDPDDEHYQELEAMAAELKAFRTASGAPYRLLPLPWPAARYDEAGERLPATYANFLVINHAVLVPTYDDPRDAEALAQIGRAFPGREIVGINCLALIRQHGSLHCVTMQLPAGVLGGAPSHGTAAASLLPCSHTQKI